MSDVNNNMMKCYLICVSAKNKETLESTNHNKFYNMEQINNTEFKVTWGRVGKNSSSKVYPIDQWNKIYRQKTQKVRNGYVYKDITNLKRVNTNNIAFKDVADEEVSYFINKIINYSNSVVSKNYNIAGAGAVTELQISAAQNVIDRLSIEIMNGYSINLKNFNDALINLFEIIPRKMDNVNKFLLSKLNKEDLIKIITREQDMLDSLKGSNALVKNESESKNESDNKTVLDALGITLEKVSEQERRNIILHMGKISNKLVRAFKISNIENRKRFDSFWQQHLNQQYPEKKKKLLWHGSRNANWLSIIQTGLLIRPSGVQLTGAMFGNGIYFAPKAKKSMGYTSVRGSYWASGNDNSGIMALYDVNMGRPLIIDRHHRWCYGLDYENLKRKGNYDSLHAKAGQSLYNDEIIIYKPEQATISYIVEIQ